jgi:uncharacterized protein
MKNQKDIVEKILSLSESKYADSEIYLFGSQARGEANSASDWDLLILLNEDEVPFEVETSIMDDFYTIELETGQIISPMIYPKKEWNSKYRITPFFRNVNREMTRLQ